MGCPSSVDCEPPAIATVVAPAIWIANHYSYSNLLQFVPDTEEEFAEQASVWRWVVQDDEVNVAAAEPSPWGAFAVAEVVATMLLGKARHQIAVLILVVCILTRPARRGP